MAHKKIVFVIVEGPSDETALGAILSGIYGVNKVHIHITHGDITTDSKIKSDGIVKKLAAIVKEYANSMHFTRNDFQQVIHLVDMDGAYIPDTAVIENAEANRCIYSLSDIQASRPANIRLRNRHKQDIINRISKLNKVWVSIPYSAYYMSCNLDHVLYGKLNSSDEDKESDAYDFVCKYKDDLDGFLAYISDSEFSVMDGYRESWEFIKKDLHSLERHTNLGLCFTQLRAERMQNLD